MDNIAQILRQAMKPYWKAFLDVRSTVDRMKDIVMNRPASITEEIDRIPGRRIFFAYIQVQNFTSAQDGIKGDPLPYVVSQDGPFVMTHYPLIMWKPNLPTTATNFGRWRPVSTWPLPTQELTGATNDIIDISYEFQDQGSGRQYQDGPVPPALLSRPDCMVPLPVPTLFDPDAKLGVTILYENIAFNAAGTATTGGALVCALPGYRIITM